jgi:hypothetical protein
LCSAALRFGSPPFTLFFFADDYLHRCRWTYPITMCFSGFDFRLGFDLEFINPVGRLSPLTPLGCSTRGSIGPSSGWAGSALIHDQIKSSSTLLHTPSISTAALPLDLFLRLNTQLGFGINTSVVRRREPSEHSIQLCLLSSFCAQSGLARVVGQVLV